jgi:uncharacterized membrane protein YkvA (DUF1232 family)
MEPNQPDPILTGDVIEDRSPATDRETLARFWAAVRRMPRYVRLAAALVRDREVPLRVKGLLGVATLYTVSPVDLVPGIIPVAGQLDDVAVLLLSLRTAVRACPPLLAQAHLDMVGLRVEDFDEDLAATRAVAALLVSRGFGAAQGARRRAAGQARALFRAWQAR